MSSDKENHSDDELNEALADDELASEHDQLELSTEDADNDDDTTAVLTKSADSTNPPSQDTQEEPSKSHRFPLSRVKAIAKLVPSVNIISADALTAIEKSLERFVREFCSDVYQTTAAEGKKIITRSHLDSVIRNLSQYEFLDGMLD